jgi:hypothetical protein
MSGAGGVDRIAGAVVGDGCSGVAYVGKGVPCDEGGNGGVVRSVGDGAGGRVGG